jgi:LEA14-like dessication related protein
MLSTIHKAATLTLGAALFAGITACGGGSASESPAPEPVPFDQPDVALRTAHIRGVGLTGGAMDIEMRVYNPNDYDLVSPRVSYRILVDGKHVADGLADPDVVVPAHDSATVRLPATFSYGSVGAAGRALIGRGALDYRVLGRMTVGTPYGRFWFPYDRAGQFAVLSAQLP